MDAVAGAAVVGRELRRRAAAGVEAQARKRAGALSPQASVPMSDAQIAAVAECLNRHGVDYVVVGGAASQLHGAPVERTRDADIVPAKTARNLDRLAAALREMGARLWVGLAEPPGRQADRPPPVAGQEFTGQPRLSHSWVGDDQDTAELPGCGPPALVLELGEFRSPAH